MSNVKKELLRQNDETLKHETERDFFQRKKTDEGSLRPRHGGEASDDGHKLHGRHDTVSDYENYGQQQSYEDNHQDFQNDRPGQRNSSFSGGTQQHRHDAPKIRHTSGLNSPRVRNNDSAPIEATEARSNFDNSKIDRLDNKADKLHNKRDIQTHKTPSQRRLRYGHYERLRADRSTDRLIAERRFGVHIDKRPLREGERNVKQRLIYQAGHAPKELLKRNVAEDEYKEGNEAVQVAHRGATEIRQRIVNPFVRKHLPFGFDYHQHKAYKLGQKEKLLRAKSDIARKTERVQLSSNRLSRAMQKRQIQKEMYKKHGVKSGVMERLKNGAKGVLREVNPLQRVIDNIKSIISAISGFFTAIQVIIHAVVIILFIAIPAIAIVSILSIFFNFGGKNTAQIEMAKITTYWSELFCNMRMDLIEADRTDTHPDYENYAIDEIRLGSGVTAYAQTEYKRQIKMLGMVSALYLDELDENTAKAEIDALFEAVYTIDVDHFNERYYCGDEDCENCPHDHYVLLLSIVEHDFDGYVEDKLNAIEDEDARDLALLQYEQYQALMGLGQICKNPFGDANDWKPRVSSVFGYRIMEENAEMHHGLDFGSPIGTELFAVADADVIDVGEDGTRGRYVVLKFPDPGGGDDIEVTYMHCDSILVTEGQTVEAKQLIAYSGNTGRSTGPHLHLGIKKGGEWLNPLLLIEFPALLGTS